MLYLSRRIKALFIAIGSTFFLSVVSISSAQTVTDDDPNRVSITIRKDQVEEAMKNIKKANTVNFRVQKTRTLTEQDLTWITSVALPRETPPLVKTECLKPLGFLNPAKITPLQAQRLGHLINSLLAEQDEKTDPKGIVKFYALTTIGEILRPKDFASAIKRLSQDKRQDVQSAAQSLLSKIQ